MNLKDLVGETTLNNMEQITQGLKLLELIEKRIKHYQKLGVDEWNEFDTHGWIVEELQKLLEKSKK